MAEMVESPQAHRTGGVARTLITVYGMVVYATFLIVFLYAIGWVEGLVVPHTINDGPDAPVAVAVVIDVVLLTVFAMQHSVMARPWFKKRWTKIVSSTTSMTTATATGASGPSLIVWGTTSPSTHPIAYRNTIRNVA